MTLADVKTWLEQCDRVTDVVTVKVSLGKPKGRRQTYGGCRYVQDGRTQIYVVGVRFKPRRVSSCFHCASAANGYFQDWYIAGYIDEVPPDFVNFHPFGPNFLLMQWDGDEPIDKYTQHSYERIPMSVEEIQK